MLSTTHTIMSVAIGAQMERAPLAFLTAFLLHLLADTLLHWNIYTDRHRWPYFWAMLDVCGGIVAAYWIAPDRFFTAPMLAAVVGGNLPDLWANGVDVLRRLRAGLARAQAARRPASSLRRLHQSLLDVHDALQYETMSPTRGLAWQVLLIAASTALART